MMSVGSEQTGYFFFAYPHTLPPTLHHISFPALVCPVCVRREVKVCIFKALLVVFPIKLLSRHNYDK